VSRQDDLGDVPVEGDLSCDVSFQDWCKRLCARQETCMRFDAGDAVKILPEVALTPNY
jgi:hypothetical protein